MYVYVMYIYDFCISDLLFKNSFPFPSRVCAQWESRVTQYERDFDRIGMTVRKEVLRFEVCLCFYNCYKRLHLCLWITVKTKSHIKS